MGEKFLPRQRVHAHDQAIGAESFTVEEAGRLQVRVKASVVVAVKLLQLNAEFGEKPFGDLAVFRRIVRTLIPVAFSKFAMVSGAMESDQL